MRQMLQEVIGRGWEDWLAKRLAVEQDSAADADASSAMLGKLQKRWAELLGPVGEYTTPVGYDSHDLVLEVECQPGGWSLQMKLLADQVIPILNSDLGFDAIQRLSITPDPDR
ncbi:DciA family protein [Streptomyces sp. NPDC093984]|uniref:DciA family protein n=1 Tax=Streptomyces sp. NPDC093984 TaxID=3366052 RepID=UPI003829A4FA